MALTDRGAAFVWTENHALFAGLDQSRAAVQYPTLVSETAVARAIASDGRNAFVVWVEGFTLRGRIFGPDYPSEVVVFLSGSAAPEVATEWNGIRYVVAWRHLSNAIVATTVDLRGGLSPFVVLTAGGADVPMDIGVNAEGSGDALVSWTRAVLDPLCSTSCTPRSSIETVLVDSEARVRNSARVASEGVHSDAVWNGYEYLLVWETAGMIEATHLRADGSLIETSPMLLEKGAAPRIAWNGSSFVLLWRSGNAALIRLLSSGGNPEGPAAGVTSATQAVDVLARNNGEYVVLCDATSRYATLMMASYFDPRHRAAR